MHHLHLLEIAMPQIEITESAHEYLKSLAEPFVDTPASVLDRLISQHQKLLGSSEVVAASPTYQRDEAVYRIESLPDLLHTKLEMAMIAKEPVSRPKWSTLVEGMIKRAAVEGHDTTTIINALEAQTWRGQKSDTGFRFVQEAGLSFQKLDANRSCRAVLGLSRAFDIPVEIQFFWRDNPKAFKPSSFGKIVGP